MSENTVSTHPADDRTGLTDTFVSRRYFRKFETITAHLGRVAGVMEADGQLSKDEVKVLTGYVMALTSLAGGTLLLGETLRPELIVTLACVVAGTFLVRPARPSDRRASATS